MSRDKDTNQSPISGTTMREVVFTPVGSNTGSDDTYRYLIAKNDDGQMFIHSLDGVPLAGPFNELFARETSSSTFLWDDRPFTHHRGFTFVSRLINDGGQLLGVFDLKAGRMLVDCIYTAIVGKSGTIINEHGMVSTLEYNFKAGLLNWAARDGKETLIDGNGKETMPLEYEHIDYNPASDDYLIPAYRNGMAGYINMYGTEKIPFTLAFAGQFFARHAIVGKWSSAASREGHRVAYGCINHRGKAVIPISYDQLEFTAVMPDGTSLLRGVQARREELITHKITLAPDGLFTTEDEQ